MATVPELVAGQIQYATNALASAQQFIDTLNNSIRRTSVIGASGALADPTNILLETLALRRYFVNFDELPGTPPISVLNGSVPVAPTAEFSETSDIAIPTFDKTFPTLSFGEVPSQLSTQAPTVDDPVFAGLPVAPNITLPQVPTIAQISLPAPPSGTIPEFSDATSLLPVADLVAPSAMFSFFEAEYSSTMLDELKAKILNDLQEGTCGINSNVEADLWHREREREVLNSNAEMEEVIRNARMRGWELPPAELAVTMQRAQERATDKLSTVSRDIGIERAKLYVDGRKFTIEQAREVETVLIGFHNSVMERSLNAAKATVQIGIEVFNARALAYNTSLDRIKTASVIFEQKIRAQLSALEIYRSQIEGKRLEVEVTKQQVESYRAQLAGIDAVVNIYKVQMEAANVQAGIERVKMEAFKIRVDAFIAQVQAKVGEFQMFEARARGQLAQAQVFESDVKAYTARVEAAKVESEVKATKVRSETEKARVLFEGFAQQVNAYRATLEGNTEQNRAVVQQFSAAMSEFTAFVNTGEKAAQISNQSVQIAGLLRSKAVDASIENAKIRLQEIVEGLRARVSMTGVAGDLYKALIAQAVGSIGTLTAVSGTQ